MTVDELREHIASGFIQNIEDIAKDFAQEFCDAINQAEQMKEECRKLRQIVEAAEKDRDEWKHRAQLAEKELEKHKKALIDMCKEYEKDVYCIYQDGSCENECYLCAYKNRLKIAGHEIEEDKQ